MQREKWVFYLPNYWIFPKVVSRDNIDNERVDDQSQSQFLDLCLFPKEEDFQVLMQPNTEATLQEQSGEESQMQAVPDSVINIDQEHEMVTYDHKEIELFQSSNTPKHNSPSWDITNLEGNLFNKLGGRRQVSFLVSHSPNSPATPTSQRR